MTTSMGESLAIRDSELIKFPADKRISAYKVSAGKKQIKWMRRNGDQAIFLFVHFDFSPLSSDSAISTSLSYPIPMLAI